MDADGRVRVEAGTHGMGTGTYTILAQVAATRSGWTRPDVTVVLGDSRLPKNGYSGGSRTAGSVGSAVLAAAAALKGELLTLATQDPASPLYGAAPADLSVTSGVAHRSSEGVDGGDAFTAILARSGRPSLEAYREVIPNEGDPKGLQEMKSGGDGSVQAVAERFARYSFGAVFAEVRIDRDFMTPRVSRLVGAFDVGRVLNRKTAESQLRGGLVWGLGMALHEGTETDPETGLAFNANLADYHMPVNATWEVSRRSRSTFRTST